MQQERGRPAKAAGIKVDDILEMVDGVKVSDMPHGLDQVLYRGRGGVGPSVKLSIMRGASLIKHGFARQVDVTEGLDLLDQAYESNLVQFGENVRDRVNFLCNCCGCCCEAMIAARKFGMMNPVHTSNFMPQVDEASCTGCGKCVSICPVEAMTLVSANEPETPHRKKARLNGEICLGCGLCVRACTEHSLSLKPLPQRVITPLNGTHRVVAMAIERGKFQHLIFDNRVLFSHRALAAVLGVFLKLPPIKQIMATRQMKSRYLEALVSYYEMRQKM